MTKFWEGVHSLKLKSCVIFALLEIMDIMRIVQGKKKLLSLQIQRLTQMLKNIYEPLVNQLKRFVASCNKQLLLRVYICLTRHMFHIAISQNKQISHGYN